MDRRPLQTTLFVVAALAAFSFYTSDAEAQLFGQRGGRSINQILFGDDGNQGGKDHRDHHCDRWMAYYYGGGCGPYGCGHHAHGHHIHGHHGQGHHGGCGPHGCGHGGGGGGYGVGAGGYGCGPGVGGSGNDLFYNYYAPQTGPEGGVTTDMYTAPHDTPHPAVQTYYTYQPWLPHEFMYEHNRNYMNYHSGPYGRTETSVSWGGSPIIREIDANQQP